MKLPEFDPLGVDLDLLYRIGTEVDINLVGTYVAFSL
jgi:hypothetical protein